MYENYISKYLGDQKIKAVTEDAAVSYLVTVETEDGKKDKYNINVLKACVTENATDLSSIREMKTVPLAEDILKLMLAARFPLSYFDYLIMKVKASIDQSADKAQSKLWGKTTDELNVADIDDILISK